MNLMTLAVIAAFAFSGCGTSTPHYGYRIRASGEHGDGGQQIRLGDIRVVFNSTGSSDSVRKRVDITAHVLNDGDSQITLAQGAARLTSGSDSWIPSDWRLYWDDSSEPERPVVDAGQQCWVACSFEAGVGRGTRFPESLTANIGTVEVDGNRVDLDGIELTWIDE
jgi:hypothetical protein